MFDVKTNFKTKYQGILHCPFCNIDEDSLEHISVCPDGLICKCSGNVSGDLDTLHAVRTWQRNFTSFQILLLWQPELKLLSITQKIKGLLFKQK